MKKLLLLLVFSASLFASAQIRSDFVIIPPNGLEEVLSVETSGTSSPTFINSDGVLYRMLDTSVLTDSFVVSGTSVSFVPPADTAIPTKSFSLTPYRHLARASASTSVVYGLSPSSTSSLTIDIVDLTGEYVDDIDVSVISFESTTLNAVGFLDLSDLPESLSIRDDVSFHGVSLSHGVYTLVLEVNGLNIESSITIGSDGIDPRIIVRYPEIDLIMFEYPCGQDIVTSDGYFCGGGVGVESVEFTVNRLGDHYFDWADGESWNEYRSKISVLSDGHIVISPAVLIGN